MLRNQVILKIESWLLRSLKLIPIFSAFQNHLSKAYKLVTKASYLCTIKLIWHGGGGEVKLTYIPFAF